MKKKLKVFKVWVKQYGWDEFDSAVIVGESKEDVLKRFVTDELGCRTYSENGDFLFFSRSQGELKIKEVDVSKPGVVVASFNAG